MFRILPVAMISTIWILWTTGVSRSPDSCVVYETASLPVFVNLVFREGVADINQLRLEAV